MYDSCWTAIGCMLFLVSNSYEAEWREKWHRETDKLGRVTSMNFVWVTFPLFHYFQNGSMQMVWKGKSESSLSSIFFGFLSYQNGMELNFHFSPSEWDGLFGLLGGFIDWMIRKSPFIPFLLIFRFGKRLLLIYVSRSTQRYLNVHGVSATNINLNSKQRGHAFKNSERGERQKL